VFKATYKPHHTFQYRAVLTATRHKPMRYSKTRKVQLTATWTKVAAGADHTCGIRPNGTLWCWGDNGYGDVGNNNAPYAAEVPTKVKDKATYATQTWADVASGFSYTCGIRTDGSLWCWGDNGNGELGLGDKTERDVPVRVGSDTNWASVFASDLHTCAIKTDQSLWCWGDNGYGELGNGATGGNVKVPTKLDDSGVNTGASQKWLDVALGTTYSCGIRDDYSLWCWGDNSAGELGVDPGTTSSSNVPVQVAGSWSAVSAGNYLISVTTPPYYGYGHTCAIKADSSLWCWGYDANGQLGDGSPDTSGTTAPQQVGSAQDWTSVSAGGAFTCGVENDTDLHCWGDNSFGQLGNGQRPTDSADPTTTVVDGYAGQVWSDTMSAGSAHVCGIDSAHILWCWGWNGYLQLGTGSYPPRDVPWVTDAG
jgi:alpha-tubulin suppressor-like RCC1 family protein